MAAERPLSRHFAELVGELAQRTPKALAVVDGDKSLSYAELDHEIDRFALALQDLGISSGGTVGLLSTNSWEWICTSLGAQRLGARVAAFNTFAKAWDLDYMLAHSEAEVLVCGVAREDTFAPVKNADATGRDPSSAAVVVGFDTPAAARAALLARRARFGEERGF